MFRDIQIGKNNFYRHKSPAPLRDVDIGKVSVSKVYFWQKKKTINTLLVTWIIIIKLSHASRKKFM